MKTTREAKHPVSYPRIITFFVTATVLSNIFRFDIFELRLQLTVLPSPIYILSIVLIEGSGIFIAALWMMNHLRKARKTEMTLYGTSDRNPFGWLSHRHPIRHGRTKRLRTGKSHLRVHLHYRFPSLLHHRRIRLARIPERRIGIAQRMETITAHRFDVVCVALVVSDECFIRRQFLLLGHTDIRQLGYRSCCRTDQVNPCFSLFSPHRANHDVQQPDP